MTKRGPRKQQQRKAKPQRAAAAPHSRALAVIDEAPIRKEAMETYLRLETQIGDARVVLESFETGDLPAYQRWEARAFGPFLTQIRELTTELQNKDMIAMAIDEEMRWTGCTAVTAYRRVMKALTEPPPVETRSERERYDDAFGDDVDPDDPFGEGPDAFPGGDKLFGDRDLPPGMDARAFDNMSPREKRDFREFYEGVAELYFMATGQEAPRLDDILREQRARSRGEARQSQSKQAQPEPEAEASPAQRAADRLKELYRKLVLQLHPDHHGEQTPRDRELWHQLQTAYKNKDLELMEALAGRIELRSNRAASSLPVAVLLRLTRELRDALRGLRSQISTAKQNPAWEFRKKSAQLAKIEARRRKNLEHQLRKLKMDLDEVRAYLEDLAARAERTKSRKKKTATPRSKAQQVAFDFFQ